MKKQTASPASSAAALVQLLATMTTLRERDVPLLERQIKLEKRGLPPSMTDTDPDAARAAAYALLNGSAAPHAPKRSSLNIRQSFLSGRPSRTPSKSAGILALSLKSKRASS
jgi:hypothetical protein